MVNWSLKTSFSKIRCFDKTILLAVVAKTNNDSKNLIISKITTERDIKRTKRFKTSEIGLNGIVVTYRVAIFI